MRNGFGGDTLRAYLLSLALLSLFPLYTIFAHPSDETQVRAPGSVAPVSGIENSTKLITVAVSSPKASVSFGSPVFVKVEISNVGEERLFIPSSFLINTGGDPAELQVWLEGANGEALPGTRIEGTSDRVRPPRGEFYALLFQYWTLLPQHYSYSTSVDLSSVIYRGITKPGNYRLWVTYTVDSIRATHTNNPLGAHLDQIATLPYPAWEGSVQSNKILVSLTPPKH